MNYYFLIKSFEKLIAFIINYYFTIGYSFKYLLVNYLFKVKCYWDLDKISNKKNIHKFFIMSYIILTIINFKIINNN